jgi:hypothetical protein
MKNMARFWIVPVIAGFVVASLVMLVFEYANSILFPIPSDLDWRDPAAVRALTASLPWTAHILVIVGWMAGSFIGGWATSKLSREEAYRASFALGVILTLAGLYNVMLLGHPLAFSVIAVPMFIIFTYLGHRYYRSRVAR